MKTRRKRKIKQKQNPGTDGSKETNCSEVEKLTRSKPAQPTGKGDKMTISVTQDYQVFSLRCHIMPSWSEL